MEPLLQPTQAPPAAPRVLRAGRHPLPPIPPPVTRSAFRGASRLLLRHYFRVEHYGRHHVPVEGPAILIGNHPSYLDPFFVGLGTSRWITWLAWEEAFNWPVIGPLVRLLGAVPLSLEKPRPSTMKAAYEVLARQRLLGLFFEGARSQGFGLDPPRRGAARIALLTGVPVVPVTLAGVRRIWPRDGIPRPGPIRVQYHPPIDSSAFPTNREGEESLTSAVAEAIASALPPDGRTRSFAWPYAKVNSSASRGGRERAAKHAGRGPGPSGFLAEPGRPS